ncbi:putative NCS2 family transporter [Leptospira ellinghausenii]|uniref:Putative NCS2 family transporter n=1 Tax=Leptospira ellinghausenii TaxID=1917822 RepID=A0A2P2DG40_9LEPT|nr:putative NCS2 family transporter [Leptospira ellinghausenii]
MGAAMIGRSIFSISLIFVLIFINLLLYDYGWVGFGVRLGSSDGYLPDLGMQLIANPWMM